MKLPKEVKNIIKTLEEAGFEAYVVGGCVRDILLDRTPKDWDLTTSAKPEKIQKLFPDSVYENDFGTVAVKTDSKDESLKIVEVTTFRSEAKYSDKRHPDSVDFTESLEEDLKRRDFTINALALRPKKKAYDIVDLFEGQKDLKEGVVRTVGSPNERFSEDALRLMRALRFATQLNFTIEGETFQAIKENAHWIKNVAEERIKDELIKMIDNKYAHNGILFMQDSGLLELVLPEIAKGIGVGQNKHHIYTVFEHNLYALKWAAEHDYPLHVKFAALLHDVGKPQTKRGEGKDSTFYGHEVVGAKIAEKLLKRLKFSKKFTEKVVLLVRYHLFYYEVGEVTESSVRRLVAKVGSDNMDDLVKVRICDRMGSGVPKPEPYRLRHFRYMIDRVQKDPISVGMLKVDGEDVMRAADVKPGKKIGRILNILLDEVLDEPKKNERKYQLEKIKDLSAKTDKELEKLEKKAKDKQNKFEQSVDEELKRKYYL
ncbi:MAG: CCA tRNA nucleotidyltransferase [Candidatus Spechtbacterales bacterium]